MKKKLIGLSVLAVVVIGGGIGGFFYYQQISKYISTEDSKVQGELRAIGSMASGKLIEWNYKEGDTFKKGDVLGIVETAPARGNIAANTQDIIAPDDGTIIQTNAVKDQTVAAGAALLMSADLRKLYVTANIEETELLDVKAGNKVTLTIDAFPGTEFKGRVDKIGLGTNSSFSLMPSSNSSGNFTKVVQRVPVKIALEDYQGKRLIPGLNAVTKIER
ncbi:HlyD family efflux transporter periplasmic adaptor subunit [Paenibacillus sp. LMG 31456]|uniref:HlyD family efflux transporter periplasmic adaptor subunit n=1 Tax=Paenibacillus foliorum TaxID=2654974 RepID=A0A972GR15_9BACL|nr:efflux RND transporter periplasmic adaptor subunit [Paenibacillus foliorum]NOU95202.1 HlyD family efflux transporter periplasmic adaptor subunit [Paenibacillus foliorum]